MAYGQCTLPEPGDGVSYMQVAAGGSHTVLLRSDGRAVACGYNVDGQCTLPEVGVGVIYVPCIAGAAELVVQLFPGGPDEGLAAVCRGLGGDIIATLIIGFEELLLIGVGSADF